MARRVRVNICGYHHIYNRGVAKGNIFNCDEDKDKFLSLLDEVAHEYKFNIHSFCLMDNHYHLLLENLQENLSDGMRQINSKYAIYFNKKYKRVGHLWQDRYKSWFVGNERYLFTLFKYIELNPIKANITQNIGEYKYSSMFYIFNNKIPNCLKQSFVLQEYETKSLLESLGLELTNKEKETLEAIKKTKLVIKNDKLTPTERKPLKEYFALNDTSDKNLRAPLIIGIAHSFLYLFIIKARRRRTNRS